MQNKKQFLIRDNSGDRKYFAMIPYYIVNHSTAYEQSLYVVMKRLASETGTCWASPQTLGKRMGVAPNTVRKYRQKLIDRGWIKFLGHKPVGATGQMTNEYEIVDLWKLNVNHYEDKSKSSPAESFQPVNQSVQLVNDKPSTVAHEEEVREIKKIKEKESRSPVIRDIAGFEVTKRFSDLELNLLRAFVKFGFSVEQNKLEDLEQWFEELEVEFLDELNLETEAKRWRDYWESKPPKNIKNSFRNWLINARKYAKNNSYKQPNR